jgi:hypothetical protein
MPAVHVDPKAIAEAGAASVAVVAGLAKGVRWVRERRQPPPETDIPRVELSSDDRRDLIERVWSQRITNGLEGSLQHAMRMELGLREAPELLQLSYAQTCGRSGDQVDLVTAYRRAGRQLVILGAPGSGKTTQALLLMRHLLDLAGRDPSAPVPEVFQLASWARDRKLLLEWLTDELQRRHGYRPSLGRSLLVHRHIIPVLDGLDEVAREHRADCLKRITQFWETHGSGPVVLCSRLKEYEELPERLRFGGAVTVDPPSDAQVQHYLAAAGPEWDPVRASLATKDNLALRQLLATPLMLSVAVLAYRAREPSELCATQDAAAQARLLWAAYVRQMHARSYDPIHPTTPPYTEAQMMRWLSWLASAMREANATELWLHEEVGPLAFLRKVRLANGLLVGLVVGLIFGLGVAQLGGLVLGLFIGVVSGLFGGVVGGLEKPKAAYRIPFDLRKARRRLGTELVGALRQGLVFGPLIGLVIGLLFGPLFGPLIGLLFGLVSGLVSGLLCGLISGLFGGVVRGLVDFGPDRTRLAVRSPTQVIDDSAHLGLVSGLLGGLVIGLSFGLVGLDGGLLFGLVGGLVVGLLGGLLAFVDHYVYRILLWRKSWAPLGWPRFLDWACDHLYLQSTGPAYQWVHIELRNYLADAYTTSHAAERLRGENE